MAKKARASASPLKGARKPKVARVTKKENDIINLKYHGPEPKAPRLGATKIEIIKAFNWYNFCKEKEDAVEYLLTFYHNNDKIKKKIASVNDFDKTAGWVARLISNGWILPDDVTDYMHNYVANIPDVKRAVKVATVEAAPPKNRLDEFLPDFEDAVDNWETDQFNAYSYLISNNVPQIYAKQIVDYYEPLKVELKAAVAGKDVDLKAGYKYLKLPKLKAYAAFIESIISDIERFLDNSKRERAPRKKKAPSVEQILKHFRYLKSHDAMKLVSIDPIKINGSSVVYTFNTAYNTFTIFVAEKGKTLQINRSTIENYDEKASKSKRVGRKYQEAVDKAFNANKASRLKILDDFNTDYITNITGRTNNNTIILGAYK